VFRINIARVQSTSVPEIIDLGSHALLWPFLLVFCRSHWHGLLTHPRELRERGMCTGVSACVCVQPCVLHTYSPSPTARELQCPVVCVNIWVLWLVPHSNLSIHFREHVILPTVASCSFPMVQRSTKLGEKEVELNVQPWTRPPRDR
jgi:hypothetical protein